MVEKERIGLAAWLTLGAAWALPLFFFVYDWEQGPARAILLALLGVVVACAHPRVARGPHLSDGAERALVRSLQVLCAALLAIHAAAAATQIAHTARTGDIVLDIGQSTYRAVLLLDQGENPYGERTIADLGSYADRRRELKQSGVKSVRSESLMEKYWRTLDLGVRDQLLRGGTSDAARRQLSLLGYKYGPADLVLAIPFVRAFGPAGVPILNVLCFFGFAAACWAFLRALPITAAGLWAALTLTLADPHALWTYTHSTASDIRALLPLALALRAGARGRPVELGLWLGLATSIKFVPAILFLPLLVAARSWPSAGAFTVVVVLFHLPFVLRDAYGLLHNVYLWGFLRAPDSTAWVHLVKPALATAVRAAAAVAMGWLAARVALRRTVAPYRDLALLAVLVLLVAKTFHNNYVPWLTWLMGAAVATAFFARPSPAPARPAR